MKSTFSEHSRSLITLSYDKARQIKEAQDDYCEKASNSLWEGIGAFPEDLQYEAAVDTLRGRVKVGRSNI